MLSALRHCEAAIPSIAEAIPVLRLLRFARNDVWMVLLGLVLACTTAFSQNDAAPVPKIISPELESVEAPKGSYRLDDVILYRIKVKWPEHVVDVRMSSPQIDLENLELMGIGEETVSKPALNDPSTEQILTLRFKAQKPGPAKINSLVLEWTQAGGASTSRLEVPSIEWAIKKPNKFAIWMLAFAAAAVAAVPGIIFLRGKKQAPQPAAPVQTLEETYLGRLERVKESAAHDSNQKNFLNELERALDQYIKEKFDWNRGQEDYNIFQKKSQRLLDKREANQLKELFEKMEYLRFSGSELKENELIVLFQSVTAFIERRKVV